MELKFAAYVHEIFTSYSSLFNSFEIIGFNMEFKLTRQIGIAECTTHTGLSNLHNNNQAMP